MFAVTLHRVLALLSAAAVLLAAAEGAARAWRRRPPGALAPRLLGLALLLIACTGAGGLALWLRGPGPREPLHLLYGVLAFGMVPLADALALRGGPQAPPRARGLARAVGALVTLVLIARLLATG